MSSSEVLRKVVLITGASSGIGAATALRLAAMGHRVMLGARRVDRVAALARTIEDGGGSAQHHVLDVTSFTSMRRFVAAALQAYGHLDVLVNNAGVMTTSLLKEARLADWNQMIEVNLKGVLNGIAAVLPTLEQQGHGHIVNIASTSAYSVSPTAAVYSATKHAVRAVSEGLRQESRHVRVTVINPGLTRTELFDGIEDVHVKAGLATMLDQSSIDAASIAEAVGFAISQPDSVDVSELMIRPLAQT